MRRWPEDQRWSVVAERRLRRRARRRTSSTRPARRRSRRSARSRRTRKNDYQAARAFFAETDKNGKWNESACRRRPRSSKRSSAQHPDLVAAQFMVGLSTTAAASLDDAEQGVSAGASHEGRPGEAGDGAVEPRRPSTGSAGKVDGARQYWDIRDQGERQARRRAHQHGVAAARAAAPTPTRRTRSGSRAEEDARFNLSQALGVDSDNVEAYTPYGLLYMEGWQTNKNRLDSREAPARRRQEAQREVPAPLQNAYGLYYMHRGALNEALQPSRPPSTADPKFVEARINVGQLTLNFRKYDAAKEMFAKALEARAEELRRDDRPRHRDARPQRLRRRGGGIQPGEAARPASATTRTSTSACSTRRSARTRSTTGPVKALRQSQDMYRKAKDFFQQALDKQTATRPTSRRRRTTSPTATRS